MPLTKGKKEPIIAITQGVAYGKEFIEIFKVKNKRELNESFKDAVDEGDQKFYHVNCLTGEELERIYDEYKKFKEDNIAKVKSALPIEEDDEGQCFGCGKPLPKGQGMCGDCSINIELAAKAMRGLKL